jgi:putative photosynthetic complex assembly protein 2
MSLFVGAILFALFTWWFTTGLILFLNHLPGRSYRWSLLGITTVLTGCIVTLPATAASPSPTGAFVAFGQGLLIWAWLEMTYFMGFLTGPRDAACPADAQGWRRFGLAVQTSLYHELAVVALGVTVLALTWGAPNPVAAATYLTLWVMRWSAKLNLFLGVANVNGDWFPAQLQYLTTYIRRRPMNGFFPFAVTVATAVMTLIIVAGLDATSTFETAALALVGSLLGLALLEHWFLVLPLQDSVLWQWCLELARRVQTGRPRRPLEQVAAGQERLAFGRESNDCA